MSSCARIPALFVSAALVVCSLSVSGVDGSGQRFIGDAETAVFVAPANINFCPVIAGQRIGRCAR